MRCLGYKIWLKSLFLGGCDILLFSNMVDFVPQARLPAARSSGKEPALLPRKYGLLGEGRPDTRERRKA